MHNLRSLNLRHVLKLVKKNECWLYEKSIHLIIYIVGTLFGFLWGSAFGGELFHQQKYHDLIFSPHVHFFLYNNIYRNKNKFVLIKWHISS